MSEVCGVELSYQNSTSGKYVYILLLAPYKYTNGTKYCIRPQDIVDAIQRRLYLHLTLSTEKV
jgi:hypothetical protein